MVFLGIDAGGTKTQFALCDESGRVLALHRAEGISLGALGSEGLREALAAHTACVLKMGKASFDALKAVCFGVPCLGENPADDALVHQIVKETFQEIPALLVNDAEVAWAGAFALAPGINLVAGTGCIAFGRDAGGKMARSGGWHHLFSDEGSGYWLGRRTLELFCKQADGRNDRGPLYDIVRRHFALESDFDLIPIAEKDILGKRDTVAALQLLLLEAAKQGDADAIQSYAIAAKEIALNVRGIIAQLDFKKPVEVSCSGGMFNVKEYLAEPFKKELADFSCAWVQGKAPPWCGALMLALKKGGCATEAALSRLVFEARENNG